MKLVIDIPDEKYEEIMSYTKWLNPMALTPFEEAVKNSIPLPKGHGRLVDMSEVIVKLMQYYDRDKTIGQCLDEVHTVIESDWE